MKADALSPGSSYKEASSQEAKVSRGKTWARTFIVASINGKEWAEQLGRFRIG